MTETIQVFSEGVPADMPSQKQCFFFKTLLRFALPNKKAVLLIFFNIADIAPERD